MDILKCNALKADLAGDATPFVSIERFFDGNDDLASIGCNLFEHPGIDRFREILLALTRRPDVDGVYALIYEVNSGDDCWPFTDTVLVFGTMSVEQLQAATEPLQPDEVSHSDRDLPATLRQRHISTPLVLWWD